MKRRTKRDLRHTRIRRKLVGSAEKPRLCVFRGLKHIYAQVINDSEGRTIASASSLERNLREKLDGKNKVEAAALVGQLLAEKALEVGVKRVVFDRGGYKFHGRVKALAEAARSAGLEF